MPRSDCIELDVRPLLAAGQTPLGAVLDCVARLAPGQSLRIVAPFEPAPLYRILAGQGFRADPSCEVDGTWTIVFRRRSARSGPSP